MGINSLLICSGALLISLSASIPSAYALARYNFPWKEQMAFGFLAFRFVPDMAILIPLYVISLRLKLYDTPLGLMLAFQTFMLPFTIWTLRNYFKEVPIELEEAAKIDGCTPIKAMFKITIPLMKPAFIFVFVTSTIGGLQMFDTSFMLWGSYPGPGGTARTLVFLIYDIAFSSSFRIGLATALGWITFFIILAVSLLYLKLFGFGRQEIE